MRGEASSYRTSRRGASERTDPSLHEQAILEKLQPQLNALPFATVFPFRLPPIPGLGATGGFEFILQSTAGDTPQNMASVLGGLVIAANQREELADDTQNRNLEDMKATGAAYCVFNCPVCMATLGEAAAEKGMFPIHLSDLCQSALEADATKG